jgi:DNA processing protein
MPGQSTNYYSPFEELVAYEALWSVRGADLRDIADRFRGGTTRPTAVWQASREPAGLFSESDDGTEHVRKFLSAKRGFGVTINGDLHYPERLKDSRSPVPLLYYRGYVGLLNRPSVAVVGARKCTVAGAGRAAAIAGALADATIPVVSGLAAGIDAAALEGALSAGGNVIGVIGTPIDESYPRENRALQARVASDHLLLSHVPFYRYTHEPFLAHKRFFPQRNDVMAAISHATVIVEASDTSGTLTQARACMQQRRPLFILDACFRDPSISWPARFEALGAFRVQDENDLLVALRRVIAELP